MTPENGKSRIYKPIEILKLNAQKTLKKDEK
jgi:hypothetical protein